MIKKRLILMLIFTLIYAAWFIGCSKEDNEKNQYGTSRVEAADSHIKTDVAADDRNTGGLKLPIVHEPVRISCIVDSAYQGRSESLVAKEVLKRTGVKLDIQEIPSPNINEKVRTIVASGKLPDILYRVPFLEINNLGMQGALVPINKYMDELPNFSRIFGKENPWVFKSLSAIDGNLYLWPYYETQRDVNHGFMYRKDIFDKHGLKEWETTEEFYQVLKKLKEIYPDSYPWANKNKAYIFAAIAYGWGLKVPMYYDENINTWKFAATQPEYKNMLDFMKKLYNEQLLDPEFLTDSQASWTAKMTKNESAFVTFDWIGRMDMFYDMVKEKNPAYNLRYANPIGPVGKVQRLNKIEQNGVAVANNENKEVTLKFLDYATSPAGARLLTMGVEGITFVRDHSGKIVYPEIKGKKVGINDLAQKYGVFLMGLYTRVDKESVYFTYTQKEQEAQDKMVKNNKIVVTDPILKFNKEEFDVCSALEQDLEKESLKFSAKYVVYKSYGDEQWKEWIERAEKIGVRKLEEAYNSAQKRYGQ